MKILPNEYTIQCKECGNIFKSRAKWNKIRLHKGDRNYSEYCGGCNITDLCGGRKPNTKSCYEFEILHKCTLCHVSIGIMRSHNDTNIQIYDDGLEDD